MLHSKEEGSTVGAILTILVGAEILEFESAIWWEAVAGSVMKPGKCASNYYITYIRSIEKKKRLLTLDDDKL